MLATVFVFGTDALKRLVAITFALSSLYVSTCVNRSFLSYALLASDHNAPFFLI
jgi:hypothetical protein